MNEKASSIKETFELAVQNQKKGNLIVAKDLYNKILEANPIHASAHCNLGVIFKGLVEHQKAIACYQKAIEINPNSPSAYNNLGMILVQLNQVNKAKKYFEKSLKLDPSRKKTCEGYGNLLLKLNQHKQALLYIRKGTGFIRFTQKDFKII